MSGRHTFGPRSGSRREAERSWSRAPASSTANAPPVKLQSRAARHDTFASAWRAGRTALIKMAASPASSACALGNNPRGGRGGTGSSSETSRFARLRFNQASGSHALSARDAGLRITGAEERASLRAGGRASAYVGVLDGSAATAKRKNVGGARKHRTRGFGAVSGTGSRRHASDLEGCSHSGAGSWC